MVRRRKMVRAYDAGAPVPAEAVEAVLQTALRAPSAGFSQGVSWLVLESPDDRELFWSLTAGPARSNAWLRGMRTAPVLLLVWTSRAQYQRRYAEPDKGWKDGDLGRWSAPYWHVDAGMASMAALFAAVDRGLAACFFGVPPERTPAVREAFGVPAEQLSVGVISLGYPAADAGLAGSSIRRRRDAATLIHRGRWQPLLPPEQPNGGLDQLV